MHIKQKRKKRETQEAQKGTATIKEVNVTIEQEEKLEEALTPTEPAETPEISTEATKLPQVVTKSEPIQKKRGRKPLIDQSKIKPSKALSEQTHVIPTKVHKKPGPKPGMKDAIEVIEAVIRAAGCEQEEKEERQREEHVDSEGASSVVGPVVTMSEGQTETICMKRFRRRPIQQNAKLSFCPYVRINNSRDFSSWCAVVNRPEDAVVFQRRRKKGILRMKNPFTVAKVEPHTVAMVQGPMLNSTLTEGSPTCALCFQPANFSALGDLCGPYYPEKDVPRKILTAEHSFRNVLKSSEEPGSSSTKEVEGLIDNLNSTQVPTEESNATRQRRYRRAPRVDRVVQEGGPKRLTLRERFRRMKQLQDKRGDHDTEISKFQEMKAEAETKEHWAHENCAVWTKGIIMVAGRLYGLKEAATNSAQTSCNKCQNLGASLGCCWRGCPHKYHFVCAKEIGCTFHDDDFSIKCPKHEGSRGRRPQGRSMTTSRDSSSAIAISDFRNPRRLLIRNQRQNFRRSFKAVALAIRLHGKT
ncbi:retinoic acid-induced protein 1-like [Neosynchiropus ocellatus]